MHGGLQFGGGVAAGIFGFLHAGFASTRVQNAPRTVDEEAARGIQPMGAYVFHGSALGPHPRHQQKGLWDELSHTPEQLRPRGAHHIHQAVGAVEAAGFGQHVFEQRRRAMKLKVFGAWVGCERQKHRPFVAERCERFHAVSAHVRCHGHGIRTEAGEQRLGVLQGRVANVSALGVGNDQHVRWNVGHDTLQGSPSLCTVLFEERQVGLVRHSVRQGGFHHRRTKRLHGRDPRPK